MPTFTAWLVELTIAAAPMLLDWGVRGLVISAMTLGAIWCLRRKSAASRHVVAFLGMLGLLMCPLVSYTLPSWRVLPEMASTSPLPPANLVESSAPATDATPPEEPVERPTAPVIAVDQAPTARSAPQEEPAPLPPQDKVEEPVSANPDVEPTVADPLPVIEPQVAVTWPALVVFTWIAGCGVLAMRLLISGIVLVRLTQHTSPVVDAKVLEIARSAQKELGVQHAVRLLVGNDSAMPMTWGLVRTHLLLPASALGWSQGRLRLVLLHELAHIRRKDFITQLVSSLSLILAWPNPLAWLLHRRLRFESERACDDLVLAADSRASEYAAELLAMNALKPFGGSALGIAMARRSQFAKRLESVLEEHHDRRPATRRLALVGTVIAACIVTPLAVLSTRISASNAASQAEVPKDTETAGATSEFVEMPVLVQVDPEPRFRLPTIRGKVTDEQGAPLAGVPVVIGPQQLQPMQTPRRFKLGGDLATTVTDAAGNFEFQGVLSGPIEDPRRTTLSVDIIARPPGRALVWKHTIGNPVVVLSAPAESSLTGRVVGSEGEPLSGAVIRVLKFFPPDQIELAGSDDSQQRQRFQAIVQRDPAALSLIGSQLQLQTESDAEGQFKLTGLPPVSGVILEIEHPDHQRSQVTAAVGLSQEQLSQLGDQPNVQVEPVSVQLKRGFRVRGRVLDARTKEPVLGTSVEATHQRTAGVQANGIVRRPEVLVNERGEFEITQLPPEYVSLHARPPANSGLVAGGKRIELVADQFDVTGDILLEDKTKGVRVQGRVVSARDGVGVEGARISWKNGQFQVAISDATGNFELFVPPGRQLVHVTEVCPGFLTPKGDDVETCGPNYSRMIEVKEDSPTEELVFTLEPAPRLRGTVVNADDQPIPNAFVRLPIQGQLDPRLWRTTDKNGQFEAVDLWTSVGDLGTSSLLALSIERNLGAAVKIRAPMKDEVAVEVKVVLQPLVAAEGRVIDELANPVAGMVVSFGDTAYAVTNAEGRFRTQLTTGQIYSMSMNTGGQDSPYDAFTPRRIDVNPLSTIQVGDLTLQTRRLRPVPRPVEFTPPSIAGANSEDAYAILRESYDDLQRELRQSTNNVTKQSRLNVQSTYMQLFMNLAEGNPGTEAALKSLIWICEARNLSNTPPHGITALRIRATQILLRDFAKRPEVARIQYDLQFADPKERERVLLTLSVTSDQDVPGRIALREAHNRAWVKARPGSEPDPSDVEQAIPLFERVIKEYGGAKDVQGQLLGPQAKGAIEYLQKWPRIGKPMQDVRGIDLSGKEMSLSDYRGKTVVVFFSAGDHLGELKKMVRRFDDQGVVVIGVSDDDRRFRALEDAKKRGHTWRIWHDSKPWPIRQAFAHTASPRASIIDSQGILRYRELQYTEIAPALDELFLERPTDSDNAAKLVARAMAKSTAIKSGRLTYAFSQGVGSRRQPVTFRLEFEERRGAVWQEPDRFPMTMVFPDHTLGFRPGSNLDTPTVVIGGPVIGRSSSWRDWKFSYVRPPLFAGYFWWQEQRVWVQQNVEKFRLVSTSEVDGLTVKVCEAELTTEDDVYQATWEGQHPSLVPGSILRLYIAPEQGCVIPLIEIVSKQGKVITRYSAKGFREESPGIYCPRVIAKDMAGRTAAELNPTTDQHSEFQVTFERVNQPVPDAVFQQIIPAGASILDGRDGRSRQYVQLKEDVPADQLTGLAP